MPRRQSYRRSCAHAGCGEQSFIEYTARRELDGVSPTWKCTRHAEPDRVLSADNTETTAVLTLHPRYIDAYHRGDPPKLVGYFWGPEGADKGHAGIEQGPGFLAHAKDFPPGTRLVVTARVEIPAASSDPGSST